MTRVPLKLFLVAILTDSPSSQAGTIPDGELVSMMNVNVHCADCADQLANIAFLHMSHAVSTHDHT